MTSLISHDKSKQVNMIHQRKLKIENKGKEDIELSPGLMGFKKKNGERKKDINDVVPLKPDEHEKSMKDTTNAIVNHDFELDRNKPRIEAEMKKESALHGNIPDNHRDRPQSETMGITNGYRLNVQERTTSGISIKKEESISGNKFLKNSTKLVNPAYQTSAVFPLTNGLSRKTCTFQNEELKTLPGQDLSNQNDESDEYQDLKATDNMQIVLRKQISEEMDKGKNYLTPNYRPMSLQLKGPVQMKLEKKLKLCVKELSSPNGRVKTNFEKNSKEQNDSAKETDLKTYVKMVGVNNIESVESIETMGNPEVSNIDMTYGVKKEAVKTQKQCEPFKWDAPNIQNGKKVKQFIT